MAKRKHKAGRTIRDKFEHNTMPNVQPRTQNQQDLLRSFIENQVTIPEGPAGVGKTYLAAYIASMDYLKGRVNKIIIARPYRSMGNYAGHIPGTDYEKLEPFLRPIIDNIKRFIGADKFDCDLHKNIEVAPVEKIRGRSFDTPCWIIIDEAQNTTIDQMKAIITRLGDNAKCCISGDSTQADVGGENGLEWLTKVSEEYKITGMNTVRFTSKDIVRGKLVKEFIQVLEEIASVKDKTNRSGRR